VSEWSQPEPDTHIKHELSFSPQYHTSYKWDYRSAPLYTNVASGCCVQLGDQWQPWTLLAAMCILGTVRIRFKTGNLLFLKGIDPPVLSQCQAVKVYLWLLHPWRRNRAVRNVNKWLPINSGHYSRREETSCEWYSGFHKGPESLH